MTFDIKTTNAAGTQGYIDARKEYREKQGYKAVEARVAMEFFSKLTGSNTISLGKPSGWVVTTYDLAEAKTLAQYLKQQDTRDNGALDGWIADGKGGRVNYYDYLQHSVPFIEGEGYDFSKIKIGDKSGTEVYKANLAFINANNNFGDATKPDQRGTDDAGYQILKGGRTLGVGTFNIA
jgi:hypothetical protein